MTDPKTTQYTSKTPPSFPSTKKAFFESFYKTSDTSGSEADIKYAKNYFTANATVIMGVKKVVGTDEIIALRKGMWEKVAERSHWPRKIFGEEGEEEVMIHGDVGYVFKDGRRAEVEWAARARFVREGSVEDPVWKMSFYQVYLDSAALQSAK